MRKSDNSNFFVGSAQNKKQEGGKVFTKFANTKSLYTIKPLYVIISNKRSETCRAISNLAETEPCCSDADKFWAESCIPEWQTRPVQRGIQSTGRASKTLKHQRHLKSIKITLLLCTSQYIFAVCSAAYSFWPACCKWTHLASLDAVEGKELLQGFCLLPGIFYEQRMASPVKDILTQKSRALLPV